MLDNLKSTFKNALVYSLGNISTKLAGFILIPLYTSYLTVSDYGVLAILEISTQFLIAVFGFKLYSALLRFYWDKDYAAKQKSIFFTTFLFLIAISVLMISVLSLIIDQFSILLFDSTSFTYLLYLVLIAASLQMILQLILTLLRIEEKSFFFSLINITRLVITLALTVYFIVYQGRGVEGIYEAQIIGLGVSLLLLVKYAIDHIDFRIELNVLKEMLTYSFPLIFAEISGVFFTITSRYCLKFLASLEEVGTFSLGYKIANTINVFVLASAMLAITPIIFKKMHDPGNKRFYAKIMTYLGFGIIICVLWISLFSREIVKFLAQNQSYWDAYHVIPILAFTVIFTMLRDISLTGLHITKKTKIIGGLISIMALVNLGLNILLIPFWRSLGAAIATLIAQIIFFGAVYRIAQKAYPIPYEIVKIGKMIFTGLLLYLVAQFTNDLNLLIRIVAKHILILFFPVLLYFLNFYEPVELERLKGYWLICKHPGQWTKIRADKK